MKKIITFFKINKERIFAGFMLFLIMILIVVVSSMFSGCDNKKTEGLNKINVSSLPLKCQLYYYTIDAVKNNDGGGLIKNKNAEKAFTIAAFWTQPCLKAIDDMELNEKQKLLDAINNLKTENKELQLRLELIKEKIKGK